MAVETIPTGPATNTAELPADAPAAREGNIPATGSGSAVSGPTGPVWDALMGNPGATVAVIATAAGVSKTAARKALAAFEADGHAIRSPGGRDGGKRTPDTWRPATPAEDTDEAAGDLPEQPATDQTGTPGTAPAEADDDHSADADQADADQADADQADADQAADGADTDLAPAQNTPAEGASTEAAESAPKESSSEDAASKDAASDHADDPPATDQTSAAPAEEGDEGEEGMDGAAATEAQAALRSLSVEIGAAIEALESSDRSAALAAAEAIYAGSGKARRLVRTAASGRPRSKATGRPRSNPGELRAKVVAHLTGHPGKEFTPHEIGKVINHSAGAVANALDRLVELGQAVVTCDRPRRFTASAAAEAASGEHTATATDGDGATGDTQEPTP